MGTMGDGGAGTAPTTGDGKAGTAATVGDGEAGTAATMGDGKAGTAATMGDGEAGTAATMGGGQAGTTAKQALDSSVVEAAMTAMQEPKSSRMIRLAAQCLMLAAAGTSYLSVGITLTWPNVLSSQLIQENSTIFHTQLHLSDWQVDMTGSMLFLGSLPGFLLSGWLVGRLGRRWSLLLSALPGMLGSVLIGLTYNTHMLLIGRFLGGVTFGMLGVASRTYVSEISDTSIRGSTMAIVNLMMQLGSMLVLALGIVMTWYQVMFVNLSALLLHCGFVATILVESPTFLAVKDRDEEAITILRRLRGPYADVDKELRLHKEMNRAAVGTYGWKGLLKLDIIKRIVVVSGIFFITNFCGVQVLKANTTRILRASGLALDVNVSAIIVYVVLFLGNFTMSILLDRLGRRWCLTLSLSLLMVAYCALGTYVFWSNSGPSPPGPSAIEADMDLQEVNTMLTYQSVSTSGSQGRYSWVPLVCLMVAAFGQSCGAGPIPWMLATEYFPTVIRSQAVSICTLIGGVQSFMSLQLYSPMQKYLTQAGLYWTYSSMAGLGILYVFIYIKETSGKSVG